MGYSFDWIEGEMREQSTCTLIEFIRQRKRWIQGYFNKSHIIVGKNEFKMNGTVIKYKF